MEQRGYGFRLCAERWEYEGSNNLTHQLLPIYWLRLQWVLLCGKWKHTSSWQWVVFAILIDNSRFVQVRCHTHGSSVPNIHASFSKISASFISSWCGHGGSCDVGLLSFYCTHGLQFHLFFAGMEMLMYGKPLRISLTISPWQHWLVSVPSHFFVCSIIKFIFILSSFGFFI